MVVTLFFSSINFLVFLYLCTYIRAEGRFTAILATADLNSFLSPFGIILSPGSVVLFDLSEADGEAGMGMA
jgi:hypothetical protein